MVSPPPTAAHWVVELFTMWPFVVGTFPIMVFFGSMGEIRFFKWIGKYAGGREGNESEDGSEEHFELRQR
jgi:hypothetical protein